MKIIVSAIRQRMWDNIRRLRKASAAVKDELLHKTVDAADLSFNLKKAFKK